jgi:hypothetical protein
LTLLVLECRQVDMVLCLGLYRRMGIRQGEFRQKLVFVTVHHPFAVRDLNAVWRLDRGCQTAQRVSAIGLYSVGIWKPRSVTLKLFVEKYNWPYC